MRRPKTPLNPMVHPTEPARMSTWHAMMMGKVAARKTWLLLAKGLLFELRACPVCSRPVLRWKSFDEVEARLFLMALRAAGGNASLAARRLRVSRRTFYNHLPPVLRDRIAGAKPGGAP